MSLANAMTGKFFDPAPQVAAAESKFAGFAVEAGIVGALLKLGSSNSNTPAQVDQYCPGGDGATHTENDVKPLVDTAAAVREPLILLVW